LEHGGEEAKILKCTVYTLRTLPPDYSISIPGLLPLRGF